MAVLERQAVLGFLNRDEIQDRLDSGELTAYSVVYTKDTLETVFINGEKELIDIKNRIYAFESMAEAIVRINKYTDTYEGQLVAVKIDDAYRGHIVNKSSTGEFYLTDLCNNPTAVDYDNLNNIPIKNIRSEAIEPVILADLDDGIYEIKGVFIAPDEKQIKSVVGNIVVVATNEFLQEKVVKRIAAKEITKYTIKPDGTKTEVYITDQFLKDNGYVTDADVDKKLAALDYVTRAEMEDYIYNTFILLVDHIIDEKIPEHIQETTEQEIEHLFEN